MSSPIILSICGWVHSASAICWLCVCLSRAVKGPFRHTSHGLQKCRGQGEAVLMLIACSVCRAQWKRSMATSILRPCQPLSTLWASHAGMSLSLILPLDINPNSSTLVTHICSPSPSLGFHAGMSAMHSSMTCTVLRSVSCHDVLCVCSHLTAHQWDCTLLWQH